MPSERSVRYVSLDENNRGGGCSERTSLEKKLLCLVFFLALIISALSLAFAFIKCEGHTSNSTTVNPSTHFITTHRPPTSNSSIPTPSTSKSSSTTKATTPTSSSTTTSARHPSTSSATTNSTPTSASSLVSTSSKNIATTRVPPNNLSNGIYA